MPLSRNSRSAFECSSVQLVDCIPSPLPFSVSSNVLGAHGRASAFSLADASGGAAALGARSPVRVIGHSLIFCCARNRDCATTRKNNLLYGTLKLWPDTSITSQMGRRQ